MMGVHALGVRLFTVRRREFGKGLAKRFVHLI